MFNRNNRNNRGQQGHLPVTDDVRIGLIGATESGKTVYIGALRQAFLLAYDDGFNMTGDDYSVGYRAGIEALLLQGDLPDPNEEGTHHKLSYNISGTVPVPRRPGLYGKLRHWFAGRRQDEQQRRNQKAEELLQGRISFDLSLSDYAGIALRKHVDAVVDDLASCDGFIYLFDPVRELRITGEYRDLQETTASSIVWGGYTEIADAFDALRARAARPDSPHQLTDTGNLPQYMVVCITKLDDPQVFSALVERQAISLDPATQGPAAHDAQLGFEKLATMNLQRMITSNFDASHRRYDMCSAVGFYADRLKDYEIPWANAGFQNVFWDDVLGRPYIRSGREYRQIFPDNLVDPLLWIYTQVKLDKIERAQAAPKNP